LFLYRLAATLGWSVAQICRDMDSQELSEWMAVHRYFMPLPDPWHQTGLLAAAAIAPYSKGRPPKASEFVPIEKPPQHPEQIAEMLRQVKRELKGE
jgi:hypothetical protein